MVACLIIKALAITCSLLASLSLAGANDDQKTDADSKQQPAVTAQKLIARAAALQREELKENSRHKRIYRNEDGSIRMLRFHDMQLSDREFQSIATIESLEVLDFSRTNVRDEHLLHYKHLPKLYNFRLHETAITDAAIKNFGDFASLRSLCMVKVKVTRAAVDHLKSIHQKKHKRDRPLGIGYRPLEK